MKTELYYSFLTVAECRNITKAAELLHLTQPTLSMQIKSIEDEYHSVFFRRLHRSVELTEAGKIFYEYCNRYLNMDQNVRIEIDNAQHSIIGTLKFGTTRSYPDELIYSLLDQYAKNYPLIHYELMELSSSELITQLDIGNIEIAVIRNKKRLPDFAEIMVSIPEDVYAICGKNNVWFPNSENGEIDLQDLQNVPLSVPSGLFSHIKGIFEEQGITPKVHALIQSRHYGLHMAEKNQAVCLLSIDKNRKNFPENVCAFRIRNNPFNITRAFIIKKDRKLSTAAEYMKELIIKNVTASSTP